MITTGGDEVGENEEHAMMEVLYMGMLCIVGQLTYMHIHLTAPYCAYNHVVK